MTLPNTSYPAQAVDYIKNRAANFQPKLGLILGSGLGELANQIKNPIKFNFSELPGFPVSTVSGHAGCLILGELGGMPVACYQGRVHAYEGASAQEFKTFIRTLKLLGCETLLITNSSGSLRPEVGPGELVLISDHINFHFGNPLIGPNDEEFGPRFFSMDHVYDAKIRQSCLKTAEQLDIKLHEGVYISVLGPCFETPAEIRAFRTLGADVVGMSTVPEVIVARHCGLRVAVVSVITNFAAGMSAEEISHEGTLHYGKLGTAKLTRLLVAVIENMKHEFC